jgi:hypothetical protein
VQLNVQIIPAPPAEYYADLSSTARVMQLRAREIDAEPTPCLVCDGTGALRRGERCRKCGGAGSARFVSCLRLDLSPTQYPAAIGMLDRMIADSIPWRAQRTVRLAESGGGLTNTGRATIVAGLRGEPLASTGGRAACSEEHAIFYVHAAIVVSYSHHRGQGDGSISRVGVDRSARHHIGIETTELWRWSDGDPGIETTPAGLRSRLDIPEAAIEAARAKARTYHCRSAFYVASGGAAGPSGALTGAGAAYGGLPSPLKGPGIGYEPA